MKPVALFILAAMNVSLRSQDLSGHLWKDRLILLLTDDIQDESYQKQLRILNADTQGMSERKLVTYLVLPEKSALHNNTKNHWIEGLNLFKKYKGSDSNFELVLIGLDGGVKRRFSDKPVKLQDLYAIIDGMPMRRAEMRRKKY